MRTIWKYQIPHEGLEVPISRPVVVLVGIDPANPDSDTPSIWLEHDEYMTIHPTRFHFIGTGHPVSMTAHHVGSCITRYGLVWHVYREDADSEAHELAAARAAAGLLADPTTSRTDDEQAVIDTAQWQRVVVHLIRQIRAVAEAAASGSMLDLIATQAEDVAQLSAENERLTSQPIRTRIPRLMPFTQADVGHEAYTWESCHGGWGEYEFETVDPFETGQADNCEYVIRKRWVLAAIDHLNTTESPNV